MDFSEKSRTEDAASADAEEKDSNGCFHTR